ncbi:MAG: hypothetical protein JXR37_23645 [Kiritimatiellae bacterium]|nr:hypothetical protein [Kiritimatiellia bacterium]
MNARYPIAAAPAAARLGAGLLAWLCPLAAVAQWQLAMEIPDEDVLQYEPIVAHITVKNFQQQAVTLGGSNATVRCFFDIGKTAGEPVAAFGDPMREQPVVVPPGKAEAFTVNLTPYYAIRSPGGYKIRAVLAAGQDMVFSREARVRVHSGFTIRKVAARLEGDARNLRVYALRYFTRDNSEILLLCAEDEDRTQCYGVARLGQIVRLRTPVTEIDGNGNIHVLHQSSPDYYTYSVVNPLGRRLHSELYTAGSAGINLYRAPDGLVDVTGGVAAESEPDAPAREEK